MSLDTQTDQGRRTPAPLWATLTVVKGPDLGARHELRQGSVLVGTQEGCGLRLSDKTVSRQHVRVALSEQGLRAEDLGSHNGTLCNGVQLQAGTVLRGAVLRLGQTEIRVDLVQRPASDTEAPAELFGLVGRTPVMREVIRTLARVATTETTVLLRGETGTGKDVAARAVHAASGRRGPFTPFDGSTVSAELVRSELFGHVPGAFTGADARREGAVARARGGTLFLDEVGELPMPAQLALLRLLETRTYSLLGDGEVRPADVRIVAATHRDLDAEVRAGRFRQDLLFRLAVVTVELPPLRERLDDLPLLVEQMARGLPGATGFDETLLESLRSFVWPGNVRELRNFLSRSVALGGTAPVEVAVEADEGDSASDYRHARQAALDRFEREFLVRLLARNGGNASQAARSAGIARGSLYRMLKKHGLV